MKPKRGLNEISEAKETLMFCEEISEISDYISNKVGRMVMGGMSKGIGNEIVGHAHIAVLWHLVFSLSVSGIQSSEIASYTNNAILRAEMFKTDQPHTTSVN